MANDVRLPSANYMLLRRGQGHRAAATGRYVQHGISSTFVPYMAL
jgi:hypothetical protein